MDSWIFGNTFDLTISNNVLNYWGLPYRSASVYYYPDVLENTTEPVQHATLAPGQTINDCWPATAYLSAAQPAFQTVKYCFFNAHLEVVPGSIYFSPTNDTTLEYSYNYNTGYGVTNAFPLLLAGAGSPMQIAGYAKLAVTNSAYTGVYAYLGQYFETNAYRVDDNGNMTANKAGIVSPYGSYYPTTVGLSALVTMPDIDTGIQGTCLVYTVSLQLDANHDGTMDLAFNGTDATSQNSPFVFWANNNFDRWNYDADDNINYMDDVAANSYAAWGADANGRPIPMPDCSYINYQLIPSGRAIPTTRDLEDFARLWVCGITTNLLSLLPTNSTVTLSWGDVASPNPTNPTIDLFQAADPDGGIGYLTNSLIASNQVALANTGSGIYVGRLGPGQSVQLNASKFASHWAGNYLIWCGVSNGTGGLKLTIADGNSNVLAQTTSYIQIKDIKQMYERWTVGDMPSKVPTNNAYLAPEDLPVGSPAFKYPLPQDTNTPYILFVHGWDMTREEKDRFAETAYKRLYWQGYQGRFGSFRWPTDNGFNATLIDAILQPHNFDSSENQAWNSALGLMNKLNDLNTEYPGKVYVLAHSMGNVVTGEALRLAAQQGMGQLVNTYVASQAAIPAHVYDATVTAPYLINYEYYAHYYPAPDAPKTPNIYGNRLTNNVAAVGHRISFYNVNDYALSADAWCFDQEHKPDAFAYGAYYYYSGSTSDSAPWNNFKSFVPVLGTVTLDIVNSLSDRYEALAFAANPYSTALGATPIGTFTRGVDLSQIWQPDLVHPNHPFDEHFYHSAEFRGDYWQQQIYWSELLGSDAFNLK